MFEAYDKIQLVNGTDIAVGNGIMFVIDCNIEAILNAAIPAKRRRAFFPNSFSIRQIPQLCRCKLPSTGKRLTVGG